MFRTVILRSDVAKEIVRKSVRSQVVRNVSFQCTRKRHTQRALVCATNTQLLRPWKITEESFVRRYSGNFPAHTKVALPALSPTMESGTIISWEKKEGDKLNEGDLLAEIETDKATMGFETPEEGYLAKILVPAGTKDIPIGKLVCIIVENEADIAAFKDFKDDAAPIAPKAPKPAAPAPATDGPAPPIAPAAAPAAPSPPAGSGGAGGRVYASPMAKRLAEQQNIRLQGKGTGLFGSLTSSDLSKLPAAGAGAPAPAEAGARAPTHVPSGPASGTAFSDIPVSGMRRTIAKRLLESKQNIPHYYLTININADNLLATRTRLNKKYEKEGVKLSVNDFVIKAVATACRKVPAANSAWMDTVIREYKNVDVSVAVSTDKGLLTPIVFQADSKGIAEISKDVKVLAGKARDGKLQPQEFQGGTISVSNLGMNGINSFCAIINPPQGCIVAVGTISKILVTADNEKGFKESNQISITLSADHRIVDGAVGANFLKALRDHLEDPITMIV